MDEEPSAVIYNSSSTGITTISINRAARRNAVNPATARKLYDAFLRFEDDPTQKICVFHGDNGTFCAGADLQELAKNGVSPRIPELGQVSNRNLGPMGPSRLQVKKPVICAVAGYAVAGGLELSLLGDMRVVEEDAVFGVFCRRFGVPLIDGGTVRLQAIVGLGRAMDMILTGRAVSAQEALAMGLGPLAPPPEKSRHTHIVSSSAAWWSSSVKSRTAVRHWLEAHSACHVQQAMQRAPPDRALH